MSHLALSVQSYETQIAQMNKQLSNSKKEELLEQKLSNMMKQESDITEERNIFEQRWKEKKQELDKLRRDHRVLTDQLSTNQIHSPVCVCVHLSVWDLRELA